MKQVIKRYHNNIYVYDQIRYEIDRGAKVVSMLLAPECGVIVVYEVKDV